MTTSSFWFEDVGLEKRPALSSDTDCDLVVVGSGIAGLSTAYEAARWGWKVVVVERQQTIGGVMTPRTTAHLASELDDYYHYLVKAVGEDDARLYHESQVAVTFSAGVGDYRAGDEVWCETLQPEEYGRALNRDVLVPRPVGRFLFGRLIGRESPEDGESSGKLHLLPLGAGMRQQVVTNAPWIAMATKLVRSL